MHSSTPISKAIITVVSYDQPSLTVATPLGPTINPYQSPSISIRGKSLLSRHISRMEPNATEA